MPRNKNDDIRDEYTIRIDERGNERYKYKACKKEWVKNLTQLQEHLNTYALRNKKQKLNSDLKKLRDFLEPFIVFIHQLEDDEPYLSSAYKILQDLKFKIVDNTKIPLEFRNNMSQAARNRWVVAYTP
ncbi:3387_t:CDS:2 [Racocetra fulgida]|uniref:3387_t:CDS:1 n=1 Tax=Racocetra fulgida TaxID=60492 RepID=A0A9N8Z2K1_9GLOM|nr:3387_t:CDS:2 [Racocetra fulgida]